MKFLTNNKNMDYILNCGLEVIKQKDNTEILQNFGFKITAQKDGSGLLHIVPIKNTLFRSERYVVIPKEIFDDIKSGNTDLFSLMEKYNYLEKLIFPRIKVVPQPQPKINTENCYQGADFFVTHEEGKYYLEYLLARQGGGERKFEISKDIYEDARKGKMSSSDIFKKYNLYHLDIPENDVK
jgi:hypothetical protein